MIPSTDQKTEAGTTKSSAQSHPARKWDEGFNHGLLAPSVLVLGLISFLLPPHNQVP